MWTFTKNQDVQAKLVPPSFSRRFWSWNPFICLGFGNHQFDPLLQSTGSVQNSSSQNQNLRFVHLVWIPSGLSSRLHQGFLFKEQMNSHKCVLNSKLRWLTNLTYHSRLVPTSLSPTIPVRCLPFSPTIFIHHSHLTYPSTFLCLSSINRRFGFIETHQEKTHWIMKWRFVSFKFSNPPSHNHF